MLRNESLAEVQNGWVDIPDIDSETIEAMLGYIYTGFVPSKLNELADKLLIAADKYQILDLKVSFFKCKIFVKKLFIIFLLPKLGKNRFL